MHLAAGQELDDVGMVELLEDGGFAFEAIERGGIAGETERNDLDGYLGPGLGVPAAIHGSHGAGDPVPCRR